MKSKGKIILIIILVLVVLVIMVSCLGSGDTAPATNTDETTEVPDTANEEKKAETEDTKATEDYEIAGTLGDEISIENIGTNQIGKYYKFVANYFSNDVAGDYKYLFMYYELGSKSAYNFYLRDAEGKDSLSFLDNKSFDDNVAVSIEARYDGLENGDHYKFTVVSAEEQAINAAEENHDKYVIGDTISYTNGLQITVNDAGYSNGYVYLDLALENVGQEQLYFSSLDVTFYSDDYALDKMGAPDASTQDFLGAVTLDSGRKATGKVFAKCPNYNEAQEVEAQIGDTIIAIKNTAIEDSKNKEKVGNITTAETTLVAGTYSLSDEITFDLSPTTGSSDSWNINFATNYDGEYNAIFGGVLNINNDGSFSLEPTYGPFNVKATLVFHETSVDVEVNSDDSPMNEAFSGTYKLTEELDMSQVG